MMGAKKKDSLTVVLFLKLCDDSSRQSQIHFILDHFETNENGFESSSLQQQPTQQLPHQNGTQTEPKKLPLKLLMDPRHVQDQNSINRQYGYEPSPMSPEFGYELVNALNAPQGKGRRFQLLQSSMDLAII